MKYSWFSVRFKIHLPLFPRSWRHQTSSIKDTRAPVECFCMSIENGQLFEFIISCWPGLQLLNLLEQTEQSWISINMGSNFEDLCFHNLHEPPSWIIYYEDCHHSTYMWSSFLTWLIDLFTNFMHTILTMVVLDNLKACPRFVRHSNN